MQFYRVITDLIPHNVSIISGNILCSASLVLLMHHIEATSMLLVRRRFAAAGSENCVDKSAMYSIFIYIKGSCLYVCACPIKTKKLQ